MKQSKLMYLPIDQVQLDAENPRIKQYLEYYTEITSEMLALALSDSSDSDAVTTFRALKESIKTSGGIIHPILVNHDKNGQYVVIEGNTRVQIYREFNAKKEDGNWTEIIAMVYEQLSEVEKHEIRLQSHLVGPRDWNPYSKAKYLYHLSEVEHIAMNTIISMCGGRASEIQRYIAAYDYMERYYRPYVTQHGYDFDTSEFSKFSEYQNTRIKSSVLKKGYEENEFAKWVAEGKIDKAMSVRLLPAIMKNDEAHKAFLKENLSAAEKVIHAAEIMDTDLSDYPYEKLAFDLRVKLEDITLTELDNLANNEQYADKRDILDRLKSKLEFIYTHMAEMEK